MSEILKFPGFIIADDRNTIIKDGKRYKNTKAMIADLSQQELRQCYEWRIRCYIRLRGWESGPEDRHAAGVLDYRARVMRYALLDLPHQDTTPQGSAGAA
jgi:hypothetical protein